MPHFQTEFGDEILIIYRDFDFLENYSNFNYNVKTQLVFQKSFIRTQRTSMEKDKK